MSAREGRWSQEAERFLAAVEGWTRASAGPEHTAAGCGWCPLCRLVAVLGGDHPELSEPLTRTGSALAQAGLLFAAAVRAAATGATAGAGGPGAQPAGAPAGDPPPRVRVQHIPLVTGTSSRSDRAQAIPSPAMCTDPEDPAAPGA